MRGKFSRQVLPGVKLCQFLTIYGKGDSLVFSHSPIIHLDFRVASQFRKGNRGLKHLPAVMQSESKILSIDFRSKLQTLVQAVGTTTAYWNRMGNGEVRCRFKARSFHRHKRAVQVIHKTNHAFDSIDEALVVFIFQIGDTAEHTREHRCSRVWSETTTDAAIGRG